MCIFLHFVFFLNFAFPDGALFNNLLLFQCMKSYLQKELESNPETFWILEREKMTYRYRKRWDSFKKRDRLICNWYEMGRGGEAGGGATEKFCLSQITENVLNHKPQTLNFTQSQITGNWIWPSQITDNTSVTDHSFILLFHKSQTLKKRKKKKTIKNDRKGTKWPCNLAV